MKLIDQIIPENPAADAIDHVRVTPSYLCPGHRIILILGLLLLSGLLSIA